MNDRRLNRPSGHSDSGAVKAIPLAAKSDVIPGWIILFGKQRVWSFDILDQRRDELQPEG